MTDKVTPFPIAVCDVCHAKVKKLHARGGKRFCTTCFLRNKRGPANDDGNNEPPKPRAA